MRRISTRPHAATDYLLPLGIAMLAGCRSLGRPFRRLAILGPLYHWSYTLFTRHEGGVVRVIPMPAHLALDAAGALTFVAAGTLLRDRPGWERWLFAGIGLSELAVIAMSDDRSTPRRGASSRP